MQKEKRDFDTAAVTWDEQPRRVKLAQEVAAAMAKQLVLTKAMRAMDFGCGTGLMSLELQHLLGSLTGVDSSKGMLDIFAAKAAQQKLSHVTTQKVDLEQGDEIVGCFDVVLSSMTIHHVQDVPLLLQTFHRVLAPGGSVAIADLDLDGGQFHEDATGVFHNGFDRLVLRRYLMDAGFGEIRDTTATSMVKPTDSGGEREFTVFLMTGCKQ